MELDVKIGISNRHVHLNKKVYDMLFDDEMKEERPLSVKGQFVSDKRVTLITDKFVKEDVKVLGPIRDYTQVEISHNDALKFGINPPVRASGDVSDAEEIIIKTDKASVMVKACILAQRHMHISKDLAEAYGLKDGQKVTLIIDNERSGGIDVYVKYTEGAEPEVHLDTDDANAFLLNNNDKGVVIF